MLCQLAIFSALVALGSGALINMAEICQKKRNGDVVPHPLDCQAYFICGKVPAIRYCDTGLHFDAMRRVCNWPEHAKCDLHSVAEVDDNDNANDGSSNVSENEMPGEVNPDKNSSPMSSMRLHPVFMAIDVQTGHITDPMDKYDPEHVECRHFGAYFLPHPYSCRRYYICAYGHLHKHKCGRGTSWNYKRQECELQSEAECYSLATTSMDIDAGKDEFLGIGNDFGDDEADDVRTTSGPMTTGTSNTQSTVCFVIDTTIVTGTTDSNWNPTGTTWNPTGTTWNPTGTTWNPTGTTWNPTGTYRPTTDKTSTAQPSTTPRADTASAELKCPQTGGAYLPNPDDCSKYFICIAGRAVATSCPPNLYWDQNAEFCDLAANVQCYKR